MRKLTKIMAAVFCFGVISAGIGCGVTFSEFISLSYVGERQMGNEDMKTTVLDYPFEPQNNHKLKIGGLYNLHLTEEDITVSQEVPSDTVRFLVTYNTAITEPILNTWNEGYVGIDMYYEVDDFEIFMYSKDRVLEDLKNRELASYTTTTITDINILVNPDTKNYITIE